MATRGVEQATPEDLPEIRRLLQEVFHAPEHLPIFSHEMLMWKAFDPHPFWEGGRSYILRLGGKVAAHVLVVPLRLQTASKTHRAQCIIDWVASKEAVGAGVLIYTHLSRMTDLQIAIGGSEESRRVLPLMGFSSYRNVRLYTRVIRPAAHLVKVRGFRPAEWLRLARDYRELFRGSRTVDEVQAVPCKSFDPAENLCLPNAAMAGGAVFEQTAESLNYLLRCPVQMEAYRFQYRDKPWGYCVLSRIHHQCRIANIWVPSSRAEDWCQALTRMVERAAADPGCTEIVMSASVPLLDTALRLAGFRTPLDSPFFVHKSQVGCLEGAEVSIGFTENDAFYL